MPSNTATEYESGNLGHRRDERWLFPVPPVDSAQDIRSEMISVMADMGVVTEKHHHEVGAAQHELGIKFDSLTKIADKQQIYKYVVHQLQMPMEKQLPSCQNQYMVIMEQVCIATNQFGRMVNQCLRL